MYGTEVSEALSQSAQSSGGKSHNEIVKTLCGEYSGRGVDKGFRQREEKDVIQEPVARLLREERAFELSSDR